MGQHIILEDGAGARIPAYIALPERGAAGAPAVVVVQEVYGLNREIRRVVDAYARAGFAALAPHLLWRVSGERVFEYAQRDEAIAAARELDEAQAAADLGAALAYLRAPSGAAGRAGLLSFGWGGKYAFRAARESRADALVAYYPGNIRQVQGLEDFDLPVAVHFGGQDPLTPPDTVALVRQAWKARSRAQVLVHAEAGHGFANPDRAEFHPGLAAAADRHSQDFLLGFLRAG